MIIDAHRHAWRYQDHFQEDFRRKAIRTRARQEVDLTVKFSEYQETSPEEVRTIVFGGKAKLSGLWVEDQYVADYVAAHSDSLIGFISVDPTQNGWEKDLYAGHQELGLKVI